ncbi:MAG TPA: transglutaminaseTgpA domain-containing protein, partial [Solirubrobacteraceae bacterium]|jgi:transglutaminase-like putative cysteine protease
VGRAAALVAGLALAFPAAGLSLGLLLRPRRWDELSAGIGQGLDALATVRLPYQAADPWPALVMAAGGALLCVLAAAVAMWPRPGGRGYPFCALAVLLTLAATPVVAIGGPQKIFVGVGLAALMACFLWLERLPLRPGFGVAALLGIALAGALPVAGAADREEPWFDYRTFAEGLGPEHPARFNWQHSYAPITWPRDRREVLRIKSDTPEYWKAETLDDFGGDAWGERPAVDSSQALETDLPSVQRPAWLREFSVAVRRLRSADVIGAGTMLGVDEPSRQVDPTDTGGFRAAGELRRGDSYSVRAYVPHPTRAELAASSAGAGGRQSDDLTMRAPFRDDVPYDELPRSPGTDGALGVANAAEIQFSPFGIGAPPQASYQQLAIRGDGAYALRRSPYRRTWRLAQRLRARSDTPYQYVVAVDRYLHGPDFAYSERPVQPPEGAAPLESFLFDTHDGYCQHYSGAMALLLRMGGIPARVATGFSPGGYSSRRKEWVVRDTDAHSWVEAWFDDYGWVTFDPTPGDTPARSQIAALPDEVRDAGADKDKDDGAGAGGRDRPGKRGDGLKKDPTFDPTNVTAASTGAEGGTDGESAFRAWWLLLGAGFAAAAGGVAVARRRGPRGPRPATPLDRAILELESAFRRAGRPAPPGTTLRQLEARLTGSEDAVAYVRALRAARYSAAAPRPTVAQRRALRRELAYGLGWVGRARALWALPPWRAM